MADIIGEINTIGDLLADVGASRFHKQDFPKAYVANTIGIRWQNDTSVSETGYHYRIERIYQIVYWGNSEVACLQKIPLLQKALKQQIKAKLRDSDDYMTLGSFAVSPPFKTDTDGVYAISGVLPVTVRVAREFAAVPKIGGIDVEVDTTAPGGDEDEYKFGTGTCGGEK